MTQLEQARDSNITQIDKILCTAKTHTTGGRDGGGSRTSEGHLDVMLSTPGTSGTGTNPEQLLAAGWSACFLSAIKIVAASTKVRLPADLAVDAEVDLGTTDGAFLLQARLNVSLPGLERSVLLRPWRTARTRPVHTPRLRATTSTSRSTWSKRDLVFAWSA